MRGTRIPVSVILGRIADGATSADILADYPQIAPEDVVAAAQFTATSVDLRELSVQHTMTRPYAAGSGRPADRRSSSRQSEVLGAELMVVPDSVAPQLGLPPGGWAIRRRRIVSDSSGPVELSTSWFDGRLAGWAPQLLEPVDIAEGTVAYLEKVTSLRASTTRESATARHARAEEKRLLELSGNRPPVVVIRHLVVDAAGRPMEYVEAVCALHRWAGAVAQLEELPARQEEEPIEEPAALPGATESPTVQQVAIETPARSWPAENAPLLFVGFLALLFLTAITFLVVAALSWS